MMVDMHTHSEFSHDSVCPIEDMARAQAARGTTAFAVTDHFDTQFYEAWGDIYTPIARAHNAVTALRARDDLGVKVLFGVEISEGFWFPDVYRRVMEEHDYDVVIGSVHAVKYGDLRTPYSMIDFSTWSTAELYAYMDAYFDEIQMMFDTVDFDVLAHLTCPLRYINGKYHGGVELARYMPRIKHILKRTIDSGKALEVNTSSWTTLHDWMPPADVLRMYRDMGGRLITLASDAHVAENASIHFGEAVAELKALGFEDMYYYEQRKPHPIKL